MSAKKPNIKFNKKIILLLSLILLLIFASFGVIGSGRGGCSSSTNETSWDSGLMESIASEGATATVEVKFTTEYPVGDYVTIVASAAGETSQTVSFSTVAAQTFYDSSDIAPFTGLTIGKTWNFLVMVYDEITYGDDLVVVLDSAVVLGSAEVDQLITSTSETVEIAVEINATGDEDEVTISMTAEVQAEVTFTYNEHCVVTTSQNYEIALDLYDELAITFDNDWITCNDADDGIDLCDSSATDAVLISSITIVGREGYDDVTIDPNDSEVLFDGDALCAQTGTHCCDFVLTVPVSSLVGNWLNYSAVTFDMTFTDSEGADVTQPISVTIPSLE
ncbi:MAG: hypothetical protein ABIA04_15970 [Pseudomonadota bacterium]